MQVLRRHLGSPNKYSVSTLQQWYQHVPEYTAVPGLLYWQQTTEAEWGLRRHRWWKIRVWWSAGDRWWGWRQQLKPFFSCLYRLTVLKIFFSTLFAHKVYPSSPKTVPIFLEFISFHPFCSVEKFQRADLNLSATSSWGAIHQLLAPDRLKEEKRGG